MALEWKRVEAYELVEGERRLFRVERRADKWLLFAYDGTTLIAAEPDPSRLEAGLASLLYTHVLPKSHPWEKP